MTRTATLTTDSTHPRRAAVPSAAANPEAFWREQGRCLDWIVPYTRVRDVTYHPQAPRIRWFEDGTLNASVNCLDRHLADRGDQAAIVWEGDDPNHTAVYTYRELHGEVCQFANGLRSLGVGRGDRVAIYLPMIPEAVVAMLACARIGAVHSVVFAGFSPASLAGRIRDCHARVLITADEGMRGGRRVALKANADAALSECPGVEYCVVVERTGAAVDWTEERDVRYPDLVAPFPRECVPEPMGAEDALFVLYTSGSTGRPKGVVHTTGGYLVHVTTTHEHVFGLRDGEVWWCTADVGWITGHSYVVYGPLANGVTTLLYEGVPNWPDPARIWEVVDRHRVNHLYTAPTAIRALMREGDAHVRRTDRRTLRVLGSVGEPINPEAWSWYHRVVGEGRCPVVDTWWQTETGGILIAPIAGVTELKPGSATLPIPGVQPVIVDDDGCVLEGACEGNLCFADGGPGMARTLYGDPERFAETYFRRFPGLYCTGDGARRDADGYYWITGRVDDVVNVSGHRIGTAEIESALVAHPAVAEAAVVGCPHAVKGEALHAFVTLMADQTPNESLREALSNRVREEIGPFAAPDGIRWTGALPKTRSGKIMRRILRRLANGESPDGTYDLGDTSTLADPSVIDSLIAEAREPSDRKQLFDRQLVDALNELLEGERAGARVARAFSAEASHIAVADALMHIGRDEVWCCAMLIGHIERIGGHVSRKTGDFYHKALRRVALADRLDYLERGQAWVVRRLREIIPETVDADLARDLRRMLEMHERNVDRCARLGTEVRAADD